MPGFRFSALSPLRGVPRTALGRRLLRYQCSDGAGGWLNYQCSDGAGGWQDYLVSHPVRAVIDGGAPASVFTDTLDGGSPEDVQ